MIKDKFHELMGKLEAAFEKMNTEQFAVYYEELGDIDPFFIEHGIKYLLANHTYKRLPLIAEIKEAMRLSMAGLSEATAKDLEGQQGYTCQVCNGMGWEMIRKHEPLYKEDHDFAISCRHCDLGRARKRAFDGEKKEYGRMEDV